MKLITTLVLLSLAAACVEVAADEATLATAGKATDDIRKAAEAVASVDPFDERAKNAERRELQEDNANLREELAALMSVGQVFR